MGDENDEFLSLMYNDDEDEIEIETDLSPETSLGTNRTRKIRVGAVEYEVPSVEYIAKLELIIAKQSVMIDQQRRQIERIKSTVLSTRDFIRRQSGRLHNMQVDIDGKLDYREYP